MARDPDAVGGGLELLELDPAAASRSIVGQLFESHAAQQPHRRPGFLRGVDGLNERGPVLTHGLQLARELWLPPVAAALAGGAAHRCGAR